MRGVCRLFVFPELRAYRFLVLFSFFDVHLTIFKLGELLVETLPNEHRVLTRIVHCIDLAASPFVHADPRGRG